MRLLKVFQRLQRLPPRLLSIKIAFARTSTLLSIESFPSIIELSEIFYKYKSFYMFSLERIYQEPLFRALGNITSTCKAFCHKRYFYRSSFDRRLSTGSLLMTGITKKRAYNYLLSICKIPKWYFIIE